jgi:hypothetical protein
VGANFIAPMFTGSLVAGSIQAVLITKGISVLTSKFALALAGNKGNLNMAFKQFLSSDTVKALAFNLAAAGISKFMCDSL